MDEPIRSRGVWWKVATLATLLAVTVLLTANVYFMGIVHSSQLQLNHRMFEVESQVNALRDELRERGDISE